MPSILVDKVHPSLVSPVEDEEPVVKALGGVVFYKEEPSVSTTNGTELAENSELTIKPNQTMWFIAKGGGTILEIKQAPGPEGEGITTAMIDNLAVTAGKLASNAVTEAKIAANAVTGVKISGEAVSGGKAAFASFPVSGAAEGEQIPSGQSGVFRTSWVVWTAKAESSVKKIKHTLGGENVACLAAIKVGTGVKKLAAGKSILKEFKVESATEIEVVFTEACTGKDEIFMLFAG
jgi:hypothetical protein